MQCGILNIGDEILAGKILNTNAFDLASRLTALGHEVAFALTWPDNIETLAEGLGALIEGRWSPACPKVDLLLVTGGLGPTQDDITRDAIARYLQVPLALHREAAEWLAARLHTQADSLPDAQLRQAILPEGVAALRNTQGTACGLDFTAHGVRVMVFPGVPSELEAMARMHVEPLLLGDTVLVRRLLWTMLSESKQRACLEGWAAPSPFQFSSLPNERGVVISLQACVPTVDADAQQLRLDAAMEELIARLPLESIVDENGLDLPQAVVRHLTDAGETLSVAESCTGGGLGFLITEVPGSSRVFREGYLTYSNEAKAGLLGVSKEVLAEHGAVSEAVVLAMARGCLLRSNASWALAISGIAGPDGGTPEKPVGTVWIAVAKRGGAAHAKCLSLKGTRNSVRWRSAYQALYLLILAQKGHIENL